MSIHEHRYAYALKIFSLLVTSLRRKVGPKREEVVIGDENVKR
jgi:hypothetical protein